MTPTILENEEVYALYDVKLSEDVFMLPRRFDTGLEYILLESRFRSADLLAERYDYGIIDSGIGVYHIIEPNAACQSPFEAVAPECRPLQPPMCIASDIWIDKHAANYARVGVRLIQPDLVHRFDKEDFPSGDDFTGFTKTMFSNGQTLLDNGPLICPTNIGDELPGGGLPYLLWVDETPSGYRIKNIVQSFPRFIFELENDSL